MMGFEPSYAPQPARGSQKNSDSYAISCLPRPSCAPSDAEMRPLNGVPRLRIAPADTTENVTHLMGREFAFDEGHTLSRAVALATHGKAIFIGQVVV